MAHAEKVFDETFTARNFSSSPLSITGLKGDKYDYELRAFFANASGDSILDITLNSDTGTNYRNYEMKGLASTANAAVGDSDTAIELQNIIGTANPGLIELRITNQSGEERYIDSLYSGDGAILKQSSFWKNTADEMDEITITAASSVTCDAHIILYRSVKDSSQGGWELVEKGSVNQNLNSSPFDIAGLDGDDDKFYRLIVRNLDTSNSSGNLLLRPNADGGTNYNAQWMRNNSGSLNANTYTGFWPGIFIEDNATNKTNVDYLINAESGADRLFTEIQATILGVDDQINKSIWWQNTADNLTSLRFFKSVSDTVTFDYFIYRPKNTVTSNNSHPFEQIHSKDLSSTDYSSGDTITIAGDSMVLLKVEGLLSNTSGDIEIRMELNSDTAANYPEQLLRSTGGSNSAASSTRNYIVLAKLQNGDQSGFSHYLYTKSGENRPGLTECCYDENALEKLAQWWSNSVDEITSVKIYASSSNAVTGNIKVSRLI